MALMEWTDDQVADVQAVFEQAYQWEKACAKKLQLAHEEGWTDDQIEDMLKKN